MTVDQPCQTHAIEWRDGVPVSTRYDDPFYSLEDGLSEASHVFVRGNGLPERFRDGFVIAELGFGTGLNFVAAARAWQAAGIQGTLRFVSFEAFPMSVSDAESALARFPVAEPYAAGIRSVLSGSNDVEIGGITLSLVRGDARLTLPEWSGAADAWFLDGFAPARNPELWEPDLLRAVAAHTRPSGTFATYTAAGAVRRALDEAGFSVERRPGFGRKRHMSAGRLR